MVICTLKSLTNIGRGIPSFGGRIQVGSFRPKEFPCRVHVRNNKSIHRSVGGNNDIAIVIRVFRRSRLSDKCIDIIGGWACISCAGMCMYRTRYDIEFVKTFKRNRYTICRPIVKRPFRIIIVKDQTVITQLVRCRTLIFHR